LIVDVLDGKWSIELVGDLGVTLGSKARNESLSSNGEFFALLDEINFNLAFAFFRYFVFDQISTVFVIGYLRSNINPIHEGFSISCLLVYDGLSLFLRQSIKGFLLFVIHHLFFRDSDIQSLNLDLELITTSCSVLTLGVSGLDEEHTFRIYVVVFQKTWTEA